MERANDAFLLVVRLLMAAMFLSAGIPKALGGYEGFAKYLGWLGVPMPEIVAIVAIAVEILGSIALIVGIFPRLTALLLALFVIIATALAHRFWEFPEPLYMAQRTQFVKNIAVLGGLLYYYVSGPGAFALAARSARSIAGEHVATEMAIRNTDAALRNIGIGGVVCTIGIIVTLATYSAAAGSPTGGRYLVAWGAILFGGLQFLYGLVQLGTAGAKTGQRHPPGR